MKNAAISLIVLFFLINHKITAQVSFTLSSSTCSGSTKTVVASTSTNTAISYTWSVLPQSPVFSTPNSATTAINFPSPGTYTITLNITLTSGSGTYSNIITVIANPTVTTTQSSATTCIVNNSPNYAKPVTISASGASSYTWAPNWTPPLTGGNGSLNSVIPSVSTCYTVYGFVSAGCTGSAVSCVSVVPQYSVEISPNPGIRCIPDSIKLSATNIQTTAIGPFTYSWTESGSGTFSGNLTPTIQAFPLNTTNYTVEVQDAALCVSLPAVSSVSVANCTGIDVNSLDNNLFFVFPNPVKSILSIENLPDNGKLSLVNILGETVYENSLGQRAVTLDMSLYTPGIYYLKIKANQGQKTIKVVLE